MSDHKPWHIQPGETRKSFDAFREYLALGDDRSLRKLAKLKGKATSTQYKRWSSRYDWTGRARAYDANQRMGETDILDKRSEVVAIILESAPNLARCLVGIALNSKNTTATRLRAVNECMGLLGISANTTPAKPKAASDDMRQLLDMVKTLPTETLASLENVVKNGKS